MLETQPSPAVGASWAWEGASRLRARQVGLGLHESPAAGSLGGGLGAQGHAAGVRVRPSEGRTAQHSQGLRPRGWPGVGPHVGLARQAEGSTGPWGWDALHPQIDISPVSSTG